MARIRSREAALPLPKSVTDAEFAALEKKVGRTFDESQRRKIEAACISYREETALQEAAPKFSEVIAEIHDLRVELQAVHERLSKLLSSDEPGPLEAVALLAARGNLRRSADAEIEPLDDFSLRVRAMANLVRDAEDTLRSNYGRRPGRDPDEACERLILALIPIASSADIPVEAYYSGSRDKWSGPFTDLLNEVLQIAAGRPVYGNGPGELASRVLRRGKAKPTEKRIPSKS